MERLSPKPPAQSDPYVEHPGFTVRFSGSLNGVRRRQLNPRADSPVAAQQSRKQRFGVGVVAECTIKMYEKISIPRPEDEAGTKLEGIPSELVLFVTGGLCSRPRFGVVATENVKKVS
jgi:hypothetical protein